MWVKRPKWTILKFATSASWWLLAGNACRGAEEGKAGELLSCPAKRFCCAQPRRLHNPRHVPARTRHAPEFCTGPGTEPRWWWHHPVCTPIGTPALAVEGQKGLRTELCSLPRGRGIPGPQFFLLLTPRSSRGGCWQGSLPCCPCSGGRADGAAFRHP